MDCRYFVNELPELYHPLSSSPQSTCGYHYGVNPFLIAARYVGDFISASVAEVGLGVLKTFFLAAAKAPALNLGVAFFTGFLGTTFLTGVVDPHLATNLLFRGELSILVFFYL